MTRVLYLSWWDWQQVGHPRSSQMTYAPQLSLLVPGSPMK